MKKFVLFLLALAMVALMIPASAEELEVPDGVTVEEIEETVDLDAEEELEEESEEELEWPDEEEDYEEYVEPEEEEYDIYEWVDLDADDLIFPAVNCEVLEDCFELSEPAEGAAIVGGHYKGELLPVVDISGDYWLLQNGNYISADVVCIYNEMEIPGETEVKTLLNPRAPRNMKMVLAPIASDVEDIVEVYHSCVIVDVNEGIAHCYKLGISTLDIRLTPLSELSQLYSFWSIDEDFLQEDAYAIGWEEVVTKIDQYTLEGSYLVIFH